jgi:hypothetical protein
MKLRSFTTKVRRCCGWQNLHNLAGNPLCNAQLMRQCDIHALEYNCAHTCDTHDQSKESKAFQLSRCCLPVCCAVQVHKVDTSVSYRARD